MKSPPREGGRGGGLRTFRAVTLFRSLAVSRLVVGLALAGLIAPLVPTAEAQDATEARLILVLGHADAVEEALEVSRSAADPLESFVQAYALATGQESDDVRARLGGDALWLSTEISAPAAVLALSGSAAAATSRALSATLPTTIQVGEADVLAEPVEPTVPALARGERPRAHGPRGP